MKSEDFSFESLPEGWRADRLGELFFVQQGKALSPEARTGVSPRPFLRTRNVLWGRLDLADVDQMAFSDDEAHRLELQPNDLLVCEGGEIGRTALWRGELPGCLYQNHIHRLRRKTDEIEPEFVMYWLQTAFLQLNLYSGAGNRTTIPNLSAARLKELALPVPPLPEQRAIAQMLSKAQASLATQISRVALLEELLRALLGSLVLGKLRLSPPTFGSGVNGA